MKKNIYFFAAFSLSAFGNATVSMAVDQTSLSERMSVVGVIAESTEGTAKPGDGVAVLSDTRSHKTFAVHVGDDVPGYGKITVKSIRRNAVIVSNGATNWVLTYAAPAADEATDVDQPSALEGRPTVMTKIQSTPGFGPYEPTGSPVAVTWNGRSHSDGAGGSGLSPDVQNQDLSRAPTIEIRDDNLDNFDLQEYNDSILEWLESTEDPFDVDNLRSDAVSGESNPNSAISSGAGHLGSERNNTPLSFE